MERRQRGWASQLSREDFRRLDPAWFAALWEGEPSPNPRETLPKTPKKKARFYLRTAKDKLSSLPPLHPPGPELAEAHRTALRGESQEIDQLVLRLKFAGSARLLYFLRFPSGPDHGDGPLEGQPDRRSSYGYYQLNESTGDEMAKDLQNALAQALDLKAYPAIDLNILEARMLRIQI
jgi:hypothetical protein